MQFQIIHILKQAQRFVSGEEISKSLGLSRTAVWKHINDLRQRGYKISAMPRKGYSLEECPDRLYPWEVQEGLKTHYFGKKIIHKDSVESTMDLACLYADQGAEHGSVFCAEMQTQGRGRQGRLWVSPYRDGIYASLLLRPSIALAESTKMVFLAGVALCDAASFLTGLDIHIKWPNDLLIGSKKIAGILTELRAQSGRIDRLIIGIGMNVNTPKKDLPPQATSLFVESGKNYFRVRLLQEFLFLCEQRYEQALEEGFGPVLSDWKKRCKLWGERVAVETGQAILEGVVLDLASDGGLILQLDDGRQHKVVTGDVVRLRRENGN